MSVLVWLGEVWGALMAGVVLGYALHLAVSWSSVTDALNEADEARLDAEAARAAVADAYDVGVAVGLEHGRGL